MKHDWKESNHGRTLSCTKCGAMCHRKVLSDFGDPWTLEDGEKARERAGVLEDCEEERVKQVMES